MKTVKCFYIKDAEVDNMKKIIPNNLKAILGTMSIHQVISKSQDAGVNTTTCTLRNEIELGEINTIFDEDAVNSIPDIDCLYLTQYVENINFDEITKLDDNPNLFEVNLPIIAIDKEIENNIYPSDNKCVYSLEKNSEAIQTPIKRVLAESNDNEPKPKKLYTIKTETNKKIVTNTVLEKNIQIKPSKSLKTPISRTIQCGACKENVSPFRTLNLAKCMASRDTRIPSVEEFVTRLARRMYDRADNGPHLHLHQIAPYVPRPPDGRPLPRELLTQREEGDASNQQPAPLPPPPPPAHDATAPPRPRLHTLHPTPPGNKSGLDLRSLPGLGSTPTHPVCLIAAGLQEETRSSRGVAKRGHLGRTKVRHMQSGEIPTPPKRCSARRRPGKGHIARGPNPQIVESKVWPPPASTLAPAVQEAIVGVVEATISTYLKKMVDEAVSDRVRDGSSSRASSVTASSVVTATTASTESAASDSEAASPPASPASTASSASAIPADESPMDTSAPPQPLPSSAAAKRPLSDHSSPSGDETAVPTPPSDSEGGFLEVASRKKKTGRSGVMRQSSSLPLLLSQPPNLPSLMGRSSHTNHHHPGPSGLSPGP
ncbi:hypothetical protein ACJJTC_017643 [Scirpophaga incertulas]